MGIRRASACAVVETSYIEAFMRKLALALLLLAPLAGCSAAPDPGEATGTAPSALAPGGAPYLALGDSIAFGFSPLLPYSPPFTQFVGYPESTAAARGLSVTNAACPGETSASLLDAAAPDNGCHTAPFYFEQGLHVPYGAATSQIDYATAFLAGHPSTALVTLDIGGNDLLLVQNACGTGTSADVCIAEALPGTVAAYARNLGEILGRLRGTGTRARIVLLTQYATNYQDPTQLAALSSLNTEITAVAALHGAVVADGYGAFLTASLSTLGDPCTAGLLIVLPDGTCNIHPSPAGRQVLTNAVLEALAAPGLGL
jgi:lysophospholipase L1-like esterase